MADAFPWPKKNKEGKIARKKFNAPVFLKPMFAKTFAAADRSAKKCELKLPVPESSSAIFSKICEHGGKKFSF